MTSEAKEGASKSWLPVYVVLFIASCIFCLVLWWRVHPKPAPYAEQVAKMTVQKLQADGTLPVQPPVSREKHVNDAPPADWSKMEESIKQTTKIIEWNDKASQWLNDCLRVEPEVWDSEKCESRQIELLASAP